MDLVGNRVLTGTSAVRYANQVDGIAYDASQNLVFVAGASSNSVIGVDPSTGATQTVAGPLITGNATALNPSPAGLAYDSVDHQLFASDPALDRVEIFNVSTTGPSFSFFQSLQLAVGSHPEGLLWLSSPDAVFVADEGTDAVTSISGATDTFLGNVTVGGGPVSMTYDPTQGYVYVADSATADMSWFLPSTLVEGTSTFPVKNNPTQIALDPSDDTIWVATASYITVINSATRASSFNLTFPASTRISGLLWDPLLGEIVAANVPANTLSFFNNSGGITGNVSTGGAPSAMVENSVLQEVDLIDPASNNLIRVSDLSETVVGTVLVGVSPGLSAFDPVTDRLVVPDTTSDRVVEVNVRAVAPGDAPRVRSLFVPGHPVAATFDPIAASIVVALVGGTVVALNSTSGAVLRTTNLGTSYTLYDTLYANHQVFVTGGTNLLWSLDPKTLAASATIQITSLASSPRLMAYSPATQLLYVTLALTGKVAVVNTSTDLVITAFPAGANPYGIALDTSNGDLFVADSGANAVNVIDPRTGTSLALLTVGTAPSALLYVASAQEVYVSDTRSNTVTVLNANSYAVVAVVAVGEYPTGLALSNVSGDVFVSDVPDSALSVIPATTPGGVPFSARLSVAPVRTDVGTTVVYTTSASYPAWDFSYQYGALPAGCVSANASVLRCTTSGSAGGVNATVLLTSAGGDTASATTPLTLIPGVSIASFTTSRAIVTLGIPITFAIVAVGGSPPYTYSYPALPPGCPAVTTAQFTCTPRSTGQYTSEVLVVDQSRLPATSSVTITVNPLLVSNPSVSPATIVLGQTATILANVSQGTTPYLISYSNLPPGCQTKNLSSLPCEPTGTGNFSITLRIVDSSGAPATRTVNLLVVAPAAASHGPPVTVYAILAAGVVVAIVAVVLYLLRRSPKRSLGPEEEASSDPGPAPETYSTTSRSIPRLPVFPAEAPGPEPAVGAPRYFSPSAEEAAEVAPPASAPAAPSGGPRANIVCRNCGAVNEAWITHCRSCKRPLQFT
ncbi:MAG: hypothetical protein L3J95_01955 [Thermoplasmata archaeon]|nr:hypothetical protein [Thermoplasmata archaeon]MCI4359175.1 hypothetical protein [Thermoplasmata archaeon]